MSFIRRVPISEATGLLKRLFHDALKRAGRVWNISHVMSLNPHVLRTSMSFYAATVFGDSPLSRTQREMIAVVVSKTNRCLY